MKKILFGALCAASLMTACSDDGLMERTSQKTEENISAVDIKLGQGGIAGRAYVKVAVGTDMSFASSSRDGISIMSLPSPMAAAMNSVGVTEMEPLYPCGEKFRERHHKAGLDRWFVVYFDKTRNLNRTVATLSAAPSFEVVEKVYATHTMAVPTPKMFQPMKSSAYEGKLPFNDPMLGDQWHYDNSGQKEGFIPGADCNLFEAWEQVTGSRNVVVAVIDGGISQQHEDLVDNLWTNTAEIPGNNIDDDGNGVVDDVHGYNTCRDNGEIFPDLVGHGTHVAGTIGARTNNGIGVSGIAGGNGDKNSGVQLMSCQTFAITDQDNRKGSPEKGLVYAADNGAVIANNSWGYNYPGPKSLPVSIKEAMDYFIDYAGYDPDEKQRLDSPMMGGLCIFAAGNDGKDYVEYPASYERVIAVGSMGPDWKRAFYSNMGDWVDIMAPGGNERLGQKAQVLSTWPEDLDEYTPDGQKINPNRAKYQWMQGTSMACPHVSGIAALALSKFGGQGYTNKELYNVVMGALRPMNLNKVNYETFGRNGVGYIDAARALDVDQKIAPEKVEKIDADVAHTQVVLKWKAVSDEDDKCPIKYHIYVSEEPIIDKNAECVKSFGMDSFGFKVGEEVSFKVMQLESNKKYYFAIDSEDRWGHFSELTTAEFTTLENHAPIITGMPDEKIRVFGLQKKEFELTISDPDNHYIKVSVEGEKRGVSYQREGDKLKFMVRAVAEIGNYEIKVAVTDELGLRTEVTIPFEVYEYKAPRRIANIDDPLVGVGKDIAIDITKYVDYDHEQKISFDVKADDASTVTMSFEGSVLHIRGLKAGSTYAKVTIADEYSSPVYLSFNVNVVDDIDALVYDVKPLEVKSRMKIFINPFINKAEIEVRSLLGTRVYSESVNPAEKNGRVKINLSKVAVGAYKLIVKTDKGDYEKSFVKI